MEAALEASLGSRAAVRSWPLRQCSLSLSAKGRQELGFSFVCLFVWFGFDLGFSLGFFFPPFILTLTLILSHLVFVAIFLASSLLLWKEDSHGTIDHFPKVFLLP